MYIWKISQNVNNGYDTYDSAIVYAETMSEARNIHPDPDWEDFASYVDEDLASQDNMAERQYAWTNYWASVDDVKVEHIGEAHWEQKTPGVILASFNAG